MIGQPVIERNIYRQLPPSAVHHGESVVSISEDAKGVSVESQTGRKVRGRYAWAADGARSTVRTALGIPFTGTKPEMLWAVMDVFLKTDFPTCPEIITFELNGQSRVAWIPRERGLSRFYVLLDGEVTLERAQASVKEHLAPYNIEFEKTEWYSTFDGRCSYSVYIAVRIILTLRQSRNVLPSRSSRNTRKSSSAEMLPTSIPSTVDRASTLASPTLLPSLGGSPWL